MTQKSSRRWGGGATTRQRKVHGSSAKGKRTVQRGLSKDSPTGSRGRGQFRPHSTGRGRNGNTPEKGVRGGVDRITSEGFSENGERPCSGGGRKARPLSDGINFVKQGKEVTGQWKKTRGSHLKGGVAGGGL